MTSPDIFTNVHKGIRRALFTACTDLGRAGDDARRTAAARAQLADVLAFVAHHGAIEDAILVPMLATRAPAIAATITRAHTGIDEHLATLRAQLPTLPAPALYRATAAFVAGYLEHLRVEEDELEPAIRAAVPAEELATLGPRAIAHTAPDDQRAMLRWMVPAMAADEAEVFLARVPPPLAAELRALL